MVYANAYEKLFTNMKNRFTVVKNDNEYTLGEYMAEKSALAEKAQEKSRNSRSGKSGFISNVADKLSGEGCHRSFPLRSLASACLCLGVISALIFSFGMFKSTSDDGISPVVSESVEGTTTLDSEIR